MVNPALVFPSTTELAHYFCDDYFVCRQRFLTSLATLGECVQKTQSWPLPQHPKLTIDGAWLGARDASKVLVFISATHGVEGYCGSAAQRFILDHLQRKSTKLPEDSAIFMIHALNPWGMQMARRVDHEGIDLNRNFVDFKASALPADPNYPKIDELLNQTDYRQRATIAAKLASTLGQDGFERALSGGQHVDSWAPFYGGKQAAFANQVIEYIIDEYALAGRELSVIDIHSGLGPWAFGELISDHPSAAKANIFAKQMFGEGIAVTENGESFSVAKSGLMDYRWHALMKEAGCYLTLEFGTYGTEALFNVLLDEHQFWHSVDNTATKAGDASLSRAAMLKHFFPDDKLWQQSVLFKTWQVLDRFLAYYA